MTKTKDPGLGSNYTEKVNRLINEDGSYNIVRHGGLKGIKDVYKFLIDIPWWKFLGIALAGYIAINVLFALAYLTAGVYGIGGVNQAQSKFMNAFYFSVQTFTSVGYGHLSPVGLKVNIIAVIESFVGLMSIALMTGLLYGRFSKPSSKISFTKNIILTPFDGGQALMFKLVNMRNSVLMNAQVNVTLILSAANSTNKEYHRLELQIDSIRFFPLTWTVVHPINEDSPFYGLSFEEIMARNPEVIVLVEAFDETHNQTVMERHSYAGEQWLSNVKFDRNFITNAEGQVELFINDLNKLSPTND